MRRSPRHLTVLGIFLVLTLPTSTSFAKPDPAVSGVLGIIPGLGHVANGDTAEGVAWFVATVGLFVSANNITRHAGFDLWLYNMYDAYWGAGGGRGAKGHNVFVNYLANFNPVNAVDYVAPPVLGFALLSRGGAKQVKGAPSGAVARAVYYSFTGLGEEGLFRGFLFPEFTYLFSSKPIGALTSSIVFAYFHVVNGVADIAPKIVLQRTILGLIMCLQTHLHKGDIRNSIFTHTWYDFLVTRGGNIDGGMVKYEFRF